LTVFIFYSTLVEDYSCKGDGGFVNNDVIILNEIEVVAVEVKPEFVVKTDFNIPMIRKGSKPEEEFRFGSEFEQFFGGRYSIREEWEKTVEVKRPLFWEVFEQSVLLAIEEGFDNTSLAQRYPPVFAPYLFNEVFAELNVTNLEKKDLKMFYLAGTPVDYFYGVDFVFVFGRSVCTGDLTISPQTKRKNKQPGHFIFTNYHLSQRQTNAFAKKIAHSLIQQEEHLVMPKGIRGVIRRALRKKYGRSKSQA
jgi:hypothetical protein